MKEFQIKQDWGDGCGGYLYFKSDSTDVVELKKLAEKMVQDEWRRISNTRFALHSPKPCRPTILVREVNEKGNPIRKGISFKTQWR